MPAAGPRRPARLGSAALSWRHFHPPHPPYHHPRPRLCPADRRGGGPPPAPEQPGSCSAGRGPAGGARLTDTAGRAGGEGREGGGGVAGSRLRESGPREEAEGRPGSEA